MSDEIYSRLPTTGVPTSRCWPIPNLRSTFSARGWSKTYAMTGWRMGYAVWPQALVESATRLAVNCHSCVNAATQYAGIAALEGPQEAVDRWSAF
ncbi:MAG: hypothetical protein Ct9H300mP16_01370 [Pseudomonadota bacterium]|nr:MAG: hypothetical protein Ct9H300mP16_01370 [Pseudomonadota bacterium]